MNKNMAKKQFRIKVLKPEQLVSFGFVKHNNPDYYEYTTQLGAHFYCDMEEVHRYTRASSKIGYLVPRYPTPAFSVELAFLLINLYNAGVIDFTIDTKEDIAKQKIAKLEAQIEKLKEEINYDD